MDQESSYVQFQHSWWKMALIILAVLVFILTCIFNGLSSTGSNGKKDNKYLLKTKLIHSTKQKIIESLMIVVLSSLFFVFQGVFTQRTGDVSDQNLTEFTPAGKNELEKTKYFQRNILLVFRLDLFYLGNHLLLASSLVSLCSLENSKEIEQKLSLHLAKYFTFHGFYFLCIESCLEHCMVDYLG